jgi:hypothetical protein
LDPIEIKVYVRSVVDHEHDGELVEMLRDPGDVVDRPAERVGSRQSYTCPRCGTRVRTLIYRSDHR